MARFIYLPEYRDSDGELFRAEVINVDCITNIEKYDSDECELHFDITGRHHSRIVPGTLLEWQKKLQEA